MKTFAVWIILTFSAASWAGSGAPQILIGDHCVNYAAWGRFSAYKSIAGTDIEEVISIARTIRTDVMQAERAVIVIRLVYGWYAANPELDAESVARAVMTLCNGVEAQWENLERCR